MWKRLGIKIVLLLIICLIKAQNPNYQYILVMPIAYNNNCQLCSVIPFSITTDIRYNYDIISEFAGKGCIPGSYYYHLTSYNIWILYLYNYNNDSQISFCFLNDFLKLDTSLNSKSLVYISSLNQNICQYFVEFSFIPLYNIIVNDRFLKEGDTLKIIYKSKDNNYNKRIPVFNCNKNNTLCCLFSANPDLIYEEKLEITNKKDNKTIIYNLNVRYDYDEGFNEFNYLTYNALYNSFNGNFKLGHEYTIIIKQYINNKTFSSIPVSFYYLPSLKINSINIIQPKCYGEEGIVSVSIGGLPSDPPSNDSIKYLYLLYEYGEDSSTAGPNVKPEDLYVIHNNKKYYFQTSLTSGVYAGDDGVPLGDNIVINSISPGVYKLKVYTLIDGKHYYPADTIFEIKQPPIFIPKVSYVNTYKKLNNTYHVRTGSATGDVLISASGGTPPYFYSINDGNKIQFTNSTKVSLQANKQHIIKIYDNNNCGGSSFIVDSLISPPNINAQITGIPPTCNNSDIGNIPDGFIEIQLSGGIPPYKISISENNQFTTFLSYIHAEIYRLVELLRPQYYNHPMYYYFDNKLLIGNENLLINYCNELLRSCSVVMICSYISDLIKYLIDFKTLLYSKSNSMNFGGLRGGIYTIEVTDTTMGKIYRFEYALDQPPPLNISSILLDSIRCYNDSAVARIQSPNKNVKYFWQLKSSNDQRFSNDSIISGLIPENTYLFSVKRELTNFSNPYFKMYCSSPTIERKMPKPPSQITFQPIDYKESSCTEAENGQMIIKIKGGIPYKDGYKIKLNNQYFKIDSIFDKYLKYGNYIISVQDSMCPIEYSYSFQINKTTDSLRFNNTGNFTESNICENRLYNKPPTGKINLAIIPGNRSSGNFKYELFDNNYERKAIVNSTSNFQEFKNLPHGDYKVIITDDSTKCKIEQTFKIDLNKNQISWRGDTIRTLPSSCNEIPDGVLKAYVKGGFPSINGYSYILKRNGYDIASLKNNDSIVIGGLYSGNDYELLAIDDSACYVKISNIHIPSKPSDIYFPVVEKKDQWCDEVNGSIKLKASTIPGKFIDTIFITYPWSNKRFFLAKGDSIKLENLKAYDNPYIFTAKENIGCTNSIPIVIKNLKNNPIAKIVKIDSTACISASNGKAIIAVKQSIYNGKYKYYLNENENIIIADTAQFEDLKSTNYKLIIEDNVGCKYDTNLFIPVIKNPLKIEKIEIIPSHCIRSADGKVVLSATGSIQKESQYIWILKSDKINKTDSLIGKNVVFKDLPVGGPYLVYLKDKYGCEDISLPFNVLFAKDTIKLVVENLINPKCPGEKSGSISVKTLNGYNDENDYALYDYNTGNQLKQTKGSDIWRIDSLKQGYYRIMVKDSVNCVASIVANILDPEPIDYSITHNYIAKKGDATGKASIVATGGNKRYIVEWYKGDNPVIENLIHDTITSDISSISGLNAGNYFVRVSDTARCRFWDDEWLEKRFIILEPEKELTLTLEEIKPVTCYGESNGKFILKGEGGWGNYYYGYDTINMSKNNVFDNLKAGIYKFYIKDTAGVFSSAYFKMTEPDILIASVVDIKDAKCYGVADGEVILDIRGGNYIYYISDDKIKWQRGNIAKNLKAGSYPLFIKDTFNCSTEVFVTINQPTPIVITDTLIRQTRCGKNDGFIRVKIDGGTPGYTYRWYDSVRNAFLDGNDSLQNVYSGPYRLIVKDDNNCISDFILYVSDITDLSLDSVKTEPVSCWGGSDGKALLFVNKGFPPYEIIWPDGRKGAFIDGLKKGRYMLSITDQEGCKIYPYIDIPSFDSIWVEPLSINLPTCKGLTNGSIEIIAKGGAGDYIYEWNTGKKKNILNGLDAGEYFVKVTDKNNCQRDFRFYLPYADTIKTILPTFVTLCKNNDYILDPGKFSKYYWYYNNKYISSEKNLVVEEPGIYSLEVEDDRGCYTSDTVVVTTSQTELEARFLAATQINLNDTIIVFETSVPVPDSIKFIVPEEFRVIEKGPYYQYLVPLDTGIYDLVLISYYKDCQDIVYKSIIVSPPILKENDLKSSDNSFFKSVKLYPNPNDGNFIVEIELKEKTDVILRLLSFGEGKIISIKHLKGANYYTENYQMNNLLPGLYLLNIEVNKEMKNFKIIVK